MKKNSLVRAILTCLVVTLFASMAMGTKIYSPNDAQQHKEIAIDIDPFMTDEEYIEYCYGINSRIESCTGTCLAREEMAEKVYQFESVQKKYSGEYNDIVFPGGIHSQEEPYVESGSIYNLDLKLVTPGKHDHDENTRYEIKTISGEHFLYEGLEVVVMKDTSACNIPVTASLTVDAFMGDWVNEDGERLVLMHSGETVIEKSPDLSWYDGEISCIEYKVDKITSSNTLKLIGITSWVSSEDTLHAAPGEEERRLSLDASSVSEEYTATKIENGIVTEMTDGTYNYTRQ
ncbi:MAG: hypothetical protein IJJ00_03750 [Erysipelotrichaceae bacterium]|nr:hypothetical protein [Erysipelotrichaceae bacterium]